MKEENKCRQAEEENLGVRSKRKGEGALHMWVFPDIKAGRDTTREELIPDDNVHM